MPSIKTDKYFEAVGRRKTSTARVRIFIAEKPEFSVNGKEAKLYFPTAEMQKIIQDPFSKLKLTEKFRVSVKVSGGGLHSQAEAIRHGLARVLIIWNAELRGKLKKAGFLKRDPRMKERRKFGLKKARKSPKWSKR